MAIIKYLVGLLFVFYLCNASDVLFDIPFKSYSEEDLELETMSFYATESSTPNFDGGVGLFAQLITLDGSWNLETLRLYSADPTSGVLGGLYFWVFNVNSSGTPGSVLFEGFAGDESLTCSNVTTDEGYSNFAYECDIPFPTTIPSFSSDFYWITVAYLNSGETQSIIFNVEESGNEVAFLCNFGKACETTENESWEFTSNIEGYGSFSIPLQITGSSDAQQISSWISLFF